MIRHVVILFLGVLLLMGCREEVVNPDNIAGNVNEPVRSNFSNYYSFAINADKVTATTSDFTYFTDNQARLSFTLLSHTSGSAEVIIFSKNNQVIYNLVIESSSEGSTFQIPNAQPYSIQLKLTNFSGKLKLTLSSQ